MFKLILVLVLSISSLLAIENNINDLDNDLVPNALDICPNTPENVFVTADGCIKQIQRTVYFEHGSFSLDADDITILEEIVAFSKELSGYKISLSGHTDSVSDYKYNQILSKKRVLTVQKSLIDKHRNSAKITLSWHGETMPVSSNVTAKGRADNRRVDIVFH